MFNWIKNLLGEKKKPLVLDNPVKAEEVTETHVESKTAHRTAEMPEEHVELVKDTVTKSKAPVTKKAVAPKAPVTKKEVVAKAPAKKAPVKKAAVTEKPAVATKRRGRPAKKAD